MLGYVFGLALVLTVFTPVIFTETFADSFSVSFDKEIYDLGDSLSISGEINQLGMPVIAMSIYDPDGKILSANNLEITSEQKFSKTIPLESPFYEKTGQYLVKLDYGQTSENYHFVIKGLSEPEILIEENTSPEILLLYTEQKQYADKDVIKIIGKVSAMDSPTALIGIYDPFGMPAGFYFGTIDSDLEFTTSFLVKDGVNFRVDGTYSVKAHYGESEAVSFFDYYKEKQIIEEPVDEKIIESLPDDKKIEQTKEVEVEVETTSPKEQPKEVEVEIESIPSKEQPNNDSQNSKPDEDSQIIKTTTTDTNKNKETKNIPKEISATKIIESENKETKTIKEKIPTPTKTKKENNLTVEDIELGKLLNQINLKCDSSTYTDTISYYDGMGPALYRLCKFDSSLNFFNESLIENPNDVEILVNKGSALGKLGYFSEAIVFYDHAIKIDPNFLPAKNNKANALANLGYLNDAILLYKQVLNQNPNYLTAAKNLDIAMSSISHLTGESSDSKIEKTFASESTLSEKTNVTKQKPDNFFDEVGVAFSALGSLFGFLN